jgi:hypothetical protein
MKKTRLGISFALMTAALFVGLTLGYSSANASMVVGQNGGIAGNGGNGGNGGVIHASNGTALNGVPGKDADGLSMSSGK